MPSLTKTAILAASAMLATGISTDAARAWGVGGAGFSVGNENARSLAVTKVSDWGHRRGHRRWAPPRHPRYFRPRYRRWRHHHHHGDEALFGALFGFAVGAVVADTVVHHTYYPPYPPYRTTTLVIGRPAGGVLIGYGIGTTMAPADHVQAAVVLERTRTGHAVEWINPDTGNRYSMMPLRTFRDGAGEDCRDYTVRGWIGGVEETLTGTACRTADGAWRTVS